MSGHNIVFMGTPEFAIPSLRALVDAGYNIRGVVTQPDRPKGRGKKLSPSPVKEAALAMRLEVVTPTTVKDQAFINWLQDRKPEIIVVVAFGRILPQTVLDFPPHGCINVHASLLPEYRGAAPIHWAVIHGKPMSGVTTMMISLALDSGDVLLRESVPISDEMTSGELHDTLKNIGAELLVRTLDQEFAGKLTRIIQDETKVTYAPPLTRTLERIDWSKSAIEIHNLVRGLNPWPGAYCKLSDLTLKIWKTNVVTHDDNQSESVPGRIRAVTACGLLVETGSDLIELKEIQPESKRRMSATECACGYCLNPGIILE